MTDHLLTTGYTRTQAGRKIDTWHYPMPDGPRLEIEIFMHSEAGNIRFEAKSKSPVLKGVSWTDTDLNALAATVGPAVKKKIGALLGTNWTEAIVLRTQTYDVGHSPSRSFGVVIERTNLQADMEGGGNTGVRDVVLPNGSKHVVHQRDHRDPLPEAEEMIRKMRFKADEDKSVLVVEATQDNQARLTRLEAIMEAFAHNLMDRISPASIAKEPIPDGDELISMMSRAVHSVADPAA